MRRQLGPAARRLDNAPPFHCSGSAFEGVFDHHFRDHPGVAFTFGSGDSGYATRFYPAASAVARLPHHCPLTTKLVVRVALTWAD